MIAEPWYLEPLREFAGLLLFLGVPCALAALRVRRQARAEAERVARTVRGWDVARGERDRVRRLADEVNERRSA